MKTYPLLLAFICLFTLPGFGQVSLDSVLKYDPSGSSWVLGGKAQSTYLPNATVLRYFSKVTPTSPWEKLDSSHYTYDANGNLLELYFTYWNPTTSSWENSFTHTYTYNASDQLTEQIFRNWNSGTGTWENSTRDEFFYDGNGRDTTRLSYQWNGAWELSHRAQRSYSANGDNTLLLIQSWDAQNTTWDPIDRQQFYYDAQHNDTMYTHDFWLNNAWNPSDKETRTYNSDNYLIEQIDFDLDGSVFIPGYKDEYIRDANNNPTLIHGYNDDNGAWILEGRQTLTFDNSYNINSLLLPLGDIDPDHFQNGRVLTYTLEELDENTGNLEPYQFEEYYYSDGNATAAPSPNAPGFDFRLYPNPAADHFFVEGLPRGGVTVSIFDRSGKQVKEVFNPSRIDLDGMPGGMYLLVVRQGGKIAGTKRLMVR